MLNDLRSQGHRHPAWMLGAGTLLWLLEVVAILYWHWDTFPPAAAHGWQSWILIIALHILTAVWFGLMWPKVLRWKHRRSSRVLPQVRAERERIAQDLHDGVGSHLVRALALLDRPEADAQAVRQAVEYAMFALRVEMEALDDADASLLERLASMRWRLQPLLVERGIAMDWVMPLEEVDTSPRSEKGLQLALLAQEAISNALQHSGSSRLRVSLQRESAGAWRLEIADEGCGIPVQQQTSGIAQQEKSRRGWGVGGMRTRAQSIGAQFELDTAPGRGTCVRVFLPKIRLA